MLPCCKILLSNSMLHHVALQLTHCAQHKSHKDSVPVVSCVCQACDDSVLDVQVFLGRGDMAACALKCAYACTTPHHWPALLAILQAGSASLQEQPDAHTSHQDLAEQLHEVLVIPCQPGSCCLRENVAMLQLYSMQEHVVQHSSQTVAAQHWP